MSVIPEAASGAKDRRDGLGRISLDNCSRDRVLLRNFREQVRTPAGRARETRVVMPDGDQTEPLGKTFPPLEIIHE
jgi:hypothetical protein